MSGQPLATVLPADVRSEDPADRLARLFDAHYDRLYRLARRLVDSADDARDLVQDAYLRAARSPRSVPRSAPDEEAWLVRVLINLRRDQWRRRAVRDRHDARLGFGPRPRSDSESALITRVAVWRALDVLHPRRRAVVVMHELEGLAVPAIASLLGIAAVTVRWHLSMGRRDLARVLAPHLGETR
jgi:RNA polymerase sigma-70 factor, ECF subfamily